MYKDATPTKTQYFMYRIRKIHFLLVYSISQQNSHLVHSLERPAVVCRNVGWSWRTGYPRVVPLPKTPEPANIVFCSGGSTRSSSSSSSEVRAMGQLESQHQTQMRLESIDCAEIRGKADDGRSVLCPAVSTFNSENFQPCVWQVCCIPPACHERTSNNRRLEEPYM